MNRLPPIQVAQRLLTERYPKAAGAFAAGSIFRGQGTPTSDLDLVILYPTLANAYRQSFTSHGWPVEVFVHNPTTLEHFYQQDGLRPVLLHMVATGNLLGDRKLLQPLQDQAQARLAAGPPPLNLNQARYALTDVRDDLIGGVSPNELTAIACAQFASLANTHLHRLGHWHAQGKSLARALNEHSPEFLTQLSQATHSAINQNPAPLLALITSELNAIGGPLFNGYEVGAPTRPSTP